MRRAFSVVAALVAALSLSVAAHAQTVDEIVAKNIKAKGGAEKWKAVSSVKMTGRVSMQGMELPLTVYAKRPNLSRQEFTIQDKQLVQAFDGTTPWAINPLAGSEAPQEITGPQADMIKADADFDGALMDYKSKGHTIELVGNEKLDGKDVHHLKVTKKGGNVQHYYLDAETGIELKQTAEIEQGGSKQQLETELSNYQPVEGIMIPHTMKQSLNGTPVVQMTIDKVEFNAPMEASLFTMPKK
jgi:outer membrane lipoprotein-sorting protein